MGNGEKIRLAGYERTSKQCLHIYGQIPLHLCPLESLQNESSLYPFMEYVITPAVRSSQSSPLSAWHTDRNTTLSSKNKLSLTKKRRLNIACPRRTKPWVSKNSTGI